MNEGMELTNEKRIRRNLEALAGTMDVSFPGRITSLGVSLGCRVSPLIERENWNEEK